MNHELATAIAEKSVALIESLLRPEEKAVAKRKFYELARAELDKPQPTRQTYLPIYGEAP